MTHILTTFTNNMGYILPIGTFPSELKLELTEEIESQDDFHERTLDDVIHDIGEEKRRMRPQISGCYYATTGFLPLIPMITGIRNK